MKQARERRGTITDAVMQKRVANMPDPQKCSFEAFDGPAMYLHPTAVFLAGHEGERIDAMMCN